MNNPPKLLFDECVGKPLVEMLRELLAMAVEENHAEVQHILDIYNQQGTKDDDWIPFIGSHGYIVITQDLGRSAGAKLPKLCVDYGITHVLLSPSMGRRKKLEKLLSILSVWYDLIGLAGEAPGSRFQIEPNGAGKAKLIRKAMPQPPELPPPPPGALFLK